jgi:poly(beta-D-mannuronate) lyase
VIRYILFMLLLGSSLLVIVSATYASDAGLRSPYRLGSTLTPVKQKIPSKQRTCPTPPTAPRTLNTTSIYAAEDSSRSRIDAEAQKRYRLAMQHVTDFNQGVAKFAQYIHEKPHYRNFYAECILKWTHEWAEAQALQKLATRTARTGIGPYASGIALSYLQAKAIKPHDRRHAVIQNWMMSIVHQYIAHFNRFPDARSSRNNLRYWAALGATAVGIAAQNRTVFNWGIGSARIGLEQITQQGTLPLEMMRKSRALLYHHHAVAPLVMTAELGLKNGINLYQDHDGALHRLALFAANTLVDDTTISMLADSRQKSIKDKTHATAWLTLYEKRFRHPPKGVPPLPATEHDSFSSNLGGELRHWNP